MILRLKELAIKSKYVDKGQSSPGEKSTADCIGCKGGLRKPTFVVKKWIRKGSGTVMWQHLRGLQTVVGLWQVKRSGWEAGSEGVRCLQAERVSMSRHTGNENSLVFHDIRSKVGKSRRKLNRSETLNRSHPVDGPNCQCERSTLTRAIWEAQMSDRTLF